jgi:hypothetical protein
MESATFSSELFSDYETAPADDTITKALRWAQQQVGIDIADIDEDDDERAWLENRAEYYAIKVKMRNAAGDFTYNKAKLSDVTKNFKMVLDELDKEWKNEILPAVRKKKYIADPTGLFNLVSPGFRYTNEGYPYEVIE